MKHSLPWSFRNPRDVDGENGQDAEQADRESGAPARAKREQRANAGERADDNEQSRKIDDPGPDLARVEAFVQISQLAEKAAVFPFDFTSAIRPVDGPHGAGTG